MTTPSPADILTAIVASTRRSLETARERRPLATLERDAARRTPDGGAFAARLSRAGQPNVIAECKRRSPSRGVLRELYDPVEIARGYEAAGAAAISVLTEPAFFDGSLEHLDAVRRAVSIPLLRKDFMVDSYQLVEARAAGADAILLIVAALSPAMLRSLMREATALELAALVEVHDEAELDVALDAEARIIGVNNRNLKTLAVSVAASERLVERIPSDRIGVAESGLRTAEDLVRLARLGYRAFLIGESLMTKPDPGEALRSLVAPMAGRGSPA